MEIKFFSDKNIFKIDTENTSYVMSLVGDEGILAHTYYGAKISDDNIFYLHRLDRYPFIQDINSRDRSSFLDALYNEFPSNNVGDYRESAVEIIDANGNEAVNFTYKSHRIFGGKPTLEGLPATFGKESEVMTLEITLTDEVLNLEAVLYYSVFENIDAIARSVILKNSSSKSIKLTKIMSMSIDMEDEGYELMSLHGSWARERQIEYRTIGHGKQSVGSVKGESSHQEHPFIALTTKNCTQNTGDVYGFNFVYSGNFLAQVEKNQFGALRVSMGINPKNFCFVLEPQQEFVAPEVILTYSGTGLGAMTRAYHDIFREHLIRSKYLHQKRPILINNWEATYFDFDSDKLISIAKKAHELGIEMLVMDDGWFGERNDDNTSLGDWTVNENKIKGGLKKLVDAVNEIGLKFGIWFEPEMISPDSNLYRMHPDWAIAIPDRTPCRSRNQYVLDLSRQDVREYVYQSLQSILNSANIEYIKWDMNRQLTDLGSVSLPKERQGELMHRYVLGMYELQERLCKEYPNILLENCSGGGARFDAGMLYYSPQIWCSDNTDAQARLSIQEGTALIYPVSTMGAHVSVCPNHTMNRNTPFQTRGNVALLGTFGYELDITKLSSQECDLVREQVKLYHCYNDLIREGDYYRIASYRENGLYDCYEIVSKDKSEALVTFVQVVSRANYPAYRIKLMGLKEEAIYMVDGIEECLHGNTIMNAGIVVSDLSGDNQSILIHVREERG